MRNLPFDARSSFFIQISYFVDFVRFNWNQIQNEMRAFVELIVSSLVYKISVSEENPEEKRGKVA